MPDLDTHALLTDFAQTNSDAAFDTLVEQHVNLVYSTALRITRNPHQAEEITQAVFIILALKAGKLPPRIVLSGWLYQTTRFTAANFLRSESRRHRREQEAYMQSVLNGPEAEPWRHIAPLLDEAMGGLGETDRNAVVLRFFENQTAAEVADALKLTEAAAHKRLNRALEKLRKFFTKRGVSLTTAMIAATISAHSVQAAPVALAKSVTAVAITKGSIAALSTLTLVKGTLKIMAWLKTKTLIAVGVGSVLAGAAVLTLQEQLDHNRRQEQAIRAEEQQIRAQEQQIRAEEQQGGLTAEQKKRLDEKLAELRAKHEALTAKHAALRVAQDQLRDQDPNPFSRPSAFVSPFTRVRFDGAKVLVTYLGDEFELATVNGVSTAEMVDFCRQHYGTQMAQKRMIEDLVIVLSDMKHPASADNTVSLTLLDAKTGAPKNVERALMTKENRQAVYSANSVLEEAASSALREQEENNRRQEQAILAQELQIRAQEQQIRAEGRQAGLPAEQKQRLDEKLDELRAKHEGLTAKHAALRAAQDQLRDQDANPFSRPSTYVSPFTRVRFDGAKALVTYLGDEFELAAVNGVSTAEMVDFCRQHYGSHMAQKRIAEDLVIVLSDMQHPARADNTVSLTLLDAKTGAEKNVERAAMTKENRQAVYSALHSDPQ